MLLFYINGDLELLNAINDNKHHNGIVKVKILLTEM